MDKLARVLSNTVSQPKQTVMELDKANRARKMGIQEVPTEQANSAGQMFTGVQAPSFAMDRDAIKQIVSSLVTETVQQVLSELFKNGNLVALNNNTANQDLMNPVHGGPNRVSNDDPIKYHETSEEDKIEEIGMQGKNGRILSSEELERRLLFLWSEALDMPKKKIGGHDSFFQLGGDSLVAMKMVGSALENGIALTVADVFLNPVFNDMLANICKAGDGEGTEVGDDEGDKTKQELFLDALDEISYEPFSLLKTNNVETFLQEHICPQLNVFRGGIVDVLPVTDFQALAITGSLLESKWMLNYFSFDGRGRLDVGKLKQSVSQIVQEYPILRTVFIAHENQLLQVVLRKLEPEFSVYETEEDLAEFALSLKEKDRTFGPQVGESYFKVVVVREKDSDHHRIILRISHAQYDGVSMPAILESLQAAYNNLPLVTGTDFSNYVNYATEDVSDEKHDHWRNLLRGSSMTHVVSREKPNYHMLTAESMTIKKTVQLHSLSSNNITDATVLKASWALVLAQTAATSDVVFGNIVNGRNAVVPGLSHVVGPCLNFNPVRAKLRSGWTALDLLHDIQGQQVTNMPYETLGFREIVKNCTDWPDWTSFSSVIQHQNFEAAEDYRFGDIDYHVSATGAPGELADVSIVTVPKEGDNVEINLSYAKNGAVTPSLAERLLNMLCMTAESVSTKPSMKLPSPTQISRMPRQMADEIESVSTDTLNTPHEKLTEYELLSLSDAVTHAWQQVLPETRSSSPINPDESFFDLGGDVVGLAQVVALLKQDGYELRLEDMIAHSVFSEQVALLAQQKAQSRTIDSSSSEEDLKALSHVEVQAIPQSPRFWKRSISRAKSFMSLRRGREGEAF